MDFRPQPFASELQPARGRPRDERVGAAVLSATRELLAELGFDHLTVDAIATRAGVGKGAIYRRWGSKAELAFAATIHDQQVEPTPDTGSLRGDLTDLICDAYRRMSDPLAIELAPAVMAALGRDPNLLQRFSQTFIASEDADVQAIIDRAAARGELTRTISAAELRLLVLGPVFAAAYGFRVPLSYGTLAGFAEVLADGLATPGAAG